MQQWISQENLELHGVSLAKKWDNHPMLFGATACFAEGLKILTEANLNVERAHTLREWARFELTHGDREQGLDHWNTAKILFEQLGLELEVARMKELPGQNGRGDGTRTSQ